MANQDIPVQLPSFQTVMCSSSVYKIDEASDCLYEGKRNEIDNLPGQYVSDVRFTRRVDKASEYDSGVLWIAWPDNQQQEVPVNTSSRDSVPRSPIINNTDGGFPSTKQNAEDPSRGTEHNKGTISMRTTPVASFVGMTNAVKQSPPFHWHIQTSPNKKGNSPCISSEGEGAIPTNRNPHIRSWHGGPILL